jgi:hypothetical protein
MASIRNKKKGSGFFGDIIKSGVKLAKDEVVGKLPIPEFVKAPVMGLADKGIDVVIDKTGLGVKKKRVYKKKGAALNLP